MLELVMIETICSPPASTKVTCALTAPLVTFWTLPSKMFRALIFMILLLKSCESGYAQQWIAASEINSTIHLCVGMA
jgi:hypothetical protein